jgi:hypothetical protein
MRPWIQSLVCVCVCVCVVWERERGQDSTKVLWSHLRIGPNDLKTSHLLKVLPPPTIAPFPQWPSLYYMALGDIPDPSNSFLPLASKAHDHLTVQSASILFPGPKVLTLSQSLQHCPKVQVQSLLWDSRQHWLWTSVRNLYAPNYSGGTSRG